MKNLKYVTTAIALILSNSVNAALISTDWQSTGDNLTTIDTSTGLQWLDLTETTNMSYNTVSGQLSTGSLFEGWRYATSLEVASLFTAFGLPLDAHLSVVGPVDSAIVDFSNTIGYIMSPAIYTYGGRGITGETYSTSQYSAGVYYVTASETNIYIGPYLGMGGSLVSRDIGRSDLGSFLVRDASVVPVPAAIWLFGSGLMGLAGVARRKARA